MTDDCKKLSAEIAQLKRRVIFLEDFLKKVARLIEPIQVSAIRAR